VQGEQEPQSGEGAEEERGLSGGGGGGAQQGGAAAQQPKKDPHHPHKHRGDTAEDIATHDREMYGVRDSTKLDAVRLACHSASV
jgi:hypothetical protein